MDVDGLYDAIVREVEVLRRLEKVSHAPDFIVSPMEEELVLGAPYDWRTPPAYPSGLAESHGLRTLERSADVVHNRFAMRIGTTELHVREKGKDQNLRSVVMLYTGQSEKFGLADTPASGMRAATPTFAYLHDNKVISTGMLIPPVAFALSWHPPGMEGYGGHPYPQTPEEFLRWNICTMGQAGFPRVPGLDALADMCFLALGAAARER